MERISREEFILNKFNKKADYKEDSIDEEINGIIMYLTQTRKRKNLTQTQLSKSTNITMNTISRIETLTTIPSLKTLLEICNALDLKLTIEPKNTNN